MRKQLIEFKIQGICQKCMDFDITVDSFNARGLTLSIKFIVQHEEQKELALQQVCREYEKTHAKLEGKLESCQEVITQFIDHGGKTNMILAPGGNVAFDGSTIQLRQHTYNCFELQKTVAGQPAESKTFTKIAKNKAMDILRGAMEDTAKGLVKKAAKDIVDLCIKLGPAIINTAAYTFFNGLL